jgi:hypothetical protein
MGNATQLEKLTYTLRNHGQTAWVSGVRLVVAQREMLNISGGVPVITCDQTNETVYDGEEDEESDEDRLEREECESEVADAQWEA